MEINRLTIIIAVLIYSQEIHGQLNSLLSNSPLRQNGLSQGFESTTGIKSIKDNLFQNEHFGKTANFNSQSQTNSQQTSIPQPSVGPSTFPSQQSQNFHSLLSQQPSQIPELPQPVIYQPQPSYLQQSFPQPSVIQQPYNYVDAPTTFAPVGIQQTPDLQSLSPQQYAGNINYQQIPTNPSVQTVPVQFSQSAPLTNSFIPTYSSLSSVPSCGSQQYVTNYGGSYISPFTTLPISVADGKIITSIPSMPYTAVISTVNPTTFGSNIAIPYQNQIFDAFEDPYDNIRDIAIDDEGSFESENLTSLLLSLLAPKKSSKYIESSYQGSPYASYSPYQKKKGTKPSSLKALLPIIFNLIKERRDGCGCHPQCKCNKKNKNKKDTEPQISGGYSKKRDYSLKEEMFRSNESDEDIPRITREHKKYKKTKIPEVSIESSENVDAEYDRVSEEEED